MTALLPVLLGGLVAAANPLALDEVLAAVNEHHPLVDVARLDRAIAGGERLAAEGSFDPTLRARGLGDWGPYTNGYTDVWIDQPTTLWGTTVFGGWRLGAGDFPIYDAKLETDTFGEVRAGVVIPLWRNGPIDRRRANIERYSLEERAAIHAQDAQVLELRRLAAMRYWEWVAHGERVRIAEQLFAIAEARDAQLRERAAAGDLAPIEVIDNERAVQARRNRLVAARRGLEQSAIELSLFFRGPDGAPVLVWPERLPGRLPEVDDISKGGVDLLVEEALAARPELKRLAEQRAQAVVELELAKNLLSPAIDLVLELSQDIGPPGEPLREPPYLEAGVLIDVPLLFRGARGRIEVANAQQARVDAQTRLARDRVTAEVQDALSAYAAAERRLRGARDEIRAARQVEEAERQRLAAGDSNVLVVNLREQATADALLVELDALLEEHRAHVLLLAATARILGGDD